MNIIDLNEEINRLKDELEGALQERDNLRDEREAMRRKYEKQERDLRLTLEQSFQQQLESMRLTLESKVTALQSQLDLMNQAATGDPCGWTEKIEDHNGETVTLYFNEETGESSDKIPRVYEFFVLVKKVEELEELKAALNVAELKAQKDEDQIQSLSKLLNHSKQQASAYAKSLKIWRNTSISISQTVNSKFVICFTLTITKIENLCS